MERLDCPLARGRTLRAGTRGCRVLPAAPLVTLSVVPLAVVQLSTLSPLDLLSMHGPVRMAVGERGVSRV